MQTQGKLKPKSKWFKGALRMFDDQFACMASTNEPILQLNF
jgi:hypothetical protein